MKDKLLKWLKYFCADFGLAERYMLSSALTEQDVSLYNLIAARTIDDMIKKFKNFRLIKLREFLHFKFVKSGVGMIEKVDVNYLKNLINEAQSNAQTSNVVVNYLRFDQKLLDKIIELAKKIDKNNLIGTLPLLEKNEFQIMLHEGIHHILHNNGFNYHWNAVNEGLCVFLHFRILENMRLFHPAQGSPQEMKDILKEVDLGKKFYKEGTYGKQIALWASYFDIRFGKFKDHDVLRVIRQWSEGKLLEDMRKELGGSYNKYNILKWYESEKA